MIAGWAILAALLSAVMIVHAPDREVMARVIKVMRRAGRVVGYHRDNGHTRVLVVQEGGQLQVVCLMRPKGPRGRA